MFKLISQYPPVHVRCTHQSMPIRITLSVELRVSVPTVGGTCIFLYHTLIEQYTHCDGTTRKLTDSDVGTGKYQPIDYYVWIAGNNAQLLFIFPTRVSLTTITLHYYSDCHRGQRFYAVPDNFEVWDTPTTGYSSVDITAVSPDGEPAGSSSVSINVNYTTVKVLMYKFSSSFYFAVSEVEFFTCERTVHQCY